MHIGIVLAVVTFNGVDYLLGLLGYIVKGVHDSMPFEFDTDIALLVLMAPVVALVWWGVHRVRDAVMKPKGGSD